MRVLLLTRTDGKRVLVNTSNIATVSEGREPSHRVVDTVASAEGRTTYVSDTMEAITYAWRNGVGAETVDVFDTNVG